MLRFRNLPKRTLGLFAVVLLLSLAAYGFAAANTLPETGAGDGQNTISGYTVSDVSYTLNTSTPSKIDSVSFDIAPTAGASAPTTVKVKLVQASSTWYSCSNTTGTTWSCDVTAGNIAASDADELRVVAAQ